MDRVLNRLLAFDGSKRWLVAIAGVPGSGKTTAATALAAKVNEVKGNGYCKAVPMDGFHLTKAELSKMPDPEKAFERRGAHWTFDAAGLEKALSGAREGRATFPGFDHSAGDPVPDEVVIPETCRVLLVEGNYLLFQALARWRQVSTLFDLTIYLECPQHIANQRLTARHMAAWGIPENVAAERALGSDYLNALLIRTTKASADIVLQVEDVSV